MIKISDNLVRFEAGDSINSYQRALVGYGFDVVANRVVSWKNSNSTCGLSIGFKVTYKLNSHYVRHDILKRKAEEFLAKNRAVLTRSVDPVVVTSNEDLSRVVFQGETVAFTRASKKSQYFYAGTTLETMIQEFRRRNVPVHPADLTFLDVTTGKTRTLKKVTTYVLE